jgi:hypothetical protein
VRGPLRSAVFGGCALDTEIGEALVLEELSQFGPRLDLAVRVVPLGAAVAPDPLLTVGELRIGVKVDLATEIAILILHEGLVTGTTQIVDGVVLRVLPAAPVIFEGDQGILLADFICALAVKLIVGQSR